MFKSETRLLDQWTKENKALVDKLNELKGENNSSQDLNQSHLKLLSSDFHKLLRNIQGLPPLAGHTQLELSVVYNVCILSICQSLVSDAQLILTQTMERVLQLKGHFNLPSDPVEFWKTVLSVENPDLKSGVTQLFCVQWAIWLNTCKMEILHDYQDQLINVQETCSKAVGPGVSLKSPDLVIEPRRLAELLQISTIIVQGAEAAKKGQSSEALNHLQAVLILSAPRSLLAHTHFLSGYCLYKMGRPQMALHCYAEALETDFRCLSALYQSVVIYRELGNTEAEIKALRLLHSALMLPKETVRSGVLPPSLLLQSLALTSLLSVPSALTVLHWLARKSLECGRVSEAVESYLDLLASLHSDQTQQRPVEEPELPRVPMLYLEAAQALLMAQRPLDCVTLCEEVVNSTAELLPDRVLLEEAEDGSEDAGVLWERSADRAALVLWTGAAHLLQGHCYAQLKDWKQAVTLYTRCINLVFNVHYKPKGSKPQTLTAAVLDTKQTHLCDLQRLKGLSLARRGIIFSQTDKLKEALRDLQLSLHAYPACVSAGLWFGEVLWRLERREEAAASWKQTGFATQTRSENVPVYLQEPQSGPSLDIEELQRRVQEFDARL